MQQTLALTNIDSLPDWRLFPKTRYQGSKRKLLPSLFRIFSSIPFDTVLDLYSGTATVSLLLRSMSKSVTANDYMLYNNCVSKLFLEATPSHFIGIDFPHDLQWLLYDAPLAEPAIVKTHYTNIYFTDDENEQIDRFAQNISSYDGFRRRLYTYAVGQALIMKRPYNLFHRANLSMRNRDVPRSFGNAVTWERPIYEHACKIVAELSRFSFPSISSEHNVTNVNTLSLGGFHNNFDLIYLDPPYMNKKSIGIDYSNFYNFLEGLCDYKFFTDGDQRYPHKPINLKPSAWASRTTALDELSRISAYWNTATLVLSYRGDGVPSKPEIVQCFEEQGRAVLNGHSEDYKYALSIKEDASEHIIIALPINT